MATIIEQDNEVTLNEGEEFGSLDDLVRTPVQEEVGPEAKATPEEDLPEKFRGKGVKDIVKSYEELEKAYGRRNNEFGELRKLVDDVIKRDLELATGGTPAQQKQKIEVNDLFDDPDKALNEAVANNPKIKQLEEQIVLRERESSRKSFESKHPDWVDVVQDPNFQSWVSGSPALLKMFKDADKNYDYSTGGELLDLYKQIHKGKVEDAKQQQQESRDKALKAATVEKGTTGQSAKKVFKRADILKMIRTSPDKYNEPAFQAELAKAYQEGRVR